MTAPIFSVNKDTISSAKSRMTEGIFKVWGNSEYDIGGEREKNGLG